MDEKEKRRHSESFAGPIEYSDISVLSTMEYLIRMKATPKSLESLGRAHPNE